MILKTYNDIVIRYSSRNTFYFNYCTNSFPKSTRKIIKAKKSVRNVKDIENCKSDYPKIEVPKITETHQPNSVRQQRQLNSETRTNEIKVQMLSKNIYHQLFGNEQRKSTASNDTIKKCIQEHRHHGLNIDNSTFLPEVNLQLPKLEGENILEHFFNIGEKLSKPYRILTEKIVNEALPPIPKNWLYKPGWYKYSVNKEPAPVDYPKDAALVFDVEVCVNSGSNPVLACAVSTESWYGWVSQSLIDEKDTFSNKILRSSELIPMESSSSVQGYNLPKEILEPKIIVGHNVSYDRARIKEQYWLEKTGARFLDTMSLHVCVSGVTSYQRSILKSKNKEIDPKDENWIEISSLNNLADVYKLYCGSEISKEPRNIFTEGTLDDVRNNFQDLMLYCANDVLATAFILKKLYPMFQNRFPHPVTFAGMLEIGSAYLPVNSNWEEYIKASNLTYNDIEIESKCILMKKADETCRLMHDDKYKKDMWMWDQDWSTQQLKMKKQPTKSKKSEKNLNVTENKIEKCEVVTKDFSKSKNIVAPEILKFIDIHEDFTTKFSHIIESKNSLFKVRPLLPGYPAWYRKLCNKFKKNEKWSPGPINITTSMRITPKLLQLTWEGYPLHYIKGEGWGFLVPFNHTLSEFENTPPVVPLETLVKNCPVVSFEPKIANETQSIGVLNNLWKDVEANIGKKQYYSKLKKNETDNNYQGTGVYSGVVLNDCCYFMRLPHKDGVSKKVGNPLAKDFLNKFSENILSGSGEDAKKVLTAARMLSYWRNNRDRIKDQKVMWLEDNDLPPMLKNQNTRFGAILPQVVVCGTLTRRATEPTWMTASNAHKERIGSELRSMIQCPKGYHLVGADVDSQELWIAAILGDSQFGIHGATPFGWMTLSGSKAAGTDMHSHTASAAKITRDHAKVINYARIYGAGQNFAERLLKQFNPTISDGDAKSKAMKMFFTTKGKRCYQLKKEYFDKVFDDTQYEGKECHLMSRNQANSIARINGKQIHEMFHKPKWIGGTESAMFNRLEEIAELDEPKTPFLECTITRALMADEDLRQRNLPTTINWVVQSGAVDFLHLMLVNMAWLTGSRSRFCLSFHDEVRYLVPEEFRYKVALALHITNLFTRAFCVKKLGLDDLPQSVAFFSSVEVDTVLRKEANADCVTPSNPHGLSKGYGVPAGETLDIWKTIEKSGGSL